MSLAARGNGEPAALLGLTHSCRRR